MLRQSFAKCLSTLAYLFLDDQLSPRRTCGFHMTSARCAIENLLGEGTEELRTCAFCAQHASLLFKRELLLRFMNVEYVVNLLFLLSLTSKFFTAEVSKFLVDVLVMVSQAYLRALNKMCNS